VQHAHDTDVVVPKEQENAHSMTEGTHSVSPKDNNENALWPAASLLLLAGGFIAIIVFLRKVGADSKASKKRQFLVNDLPPNKALGLSTYMVYSRWNRQLKMWS